MYHIWHINKLALRISRNDYVDYRDELGKFHLSKVVDKKNSEILLHYCEFEWRNQNFDFWINVENDCNKIGFATNVSVDDNVNNIDSKWRVGRIEKFDNVGNQCTGQVKIRLATASPKYTSFWTHLDNINEFTPTGVHMEIQKMNLY